MNFEPRRILTPQRGSNLDSRVSSVRVMNDRKPTSAQLAQLAYRHDQHLAKIRNSLAGFVTSEGRLDDGSAFRIISNSGIHTLLLWPAGGEPPPLELGDWFRAIPASNSFLNGNGDKPSWGWQFPRKQGDLNGWPSRHKPLSLKTEHPGHVSWSNPTLTVDNKPLVLTWHGPRDRYAPTTGHLTATGGGITAHERNPGSWPGDVTLELAQDVLRDGPYVWINGHRVDTGVPKVIAACLHQYDPSGAPGQFVLRVCADRTIASADRQLVVYDLVPASGAEGGTLQSFAQASAALHVKAEYLAADNTNAANPGGGTPGAGKWDYWQRPHFNRSGTRLATLIIKVGANGTDRESHAVSFDPTTWAVVDDVTATITASQTSTFGSASPWTATYDVSQDFFVACDFDADTFVYVKLVLQREGEQSGESQGEVQSGVYAGTQDRLMTETYTVSHSTLGQLAQHTSTDTQHHFYRVVSAGPGLRTITHDYARTVTNGWNADAQEATAAAAPHFAFIGDLSRGTFAVGYPKAGGTHAGEGHLSGTYSNSDPLQFASVDNTNVRPAMLFDVWFDGALAAAATTGAVPEPAAITHSFTFQPSLSLADMQPQLPNATAGANTGGAMARVSPQTSPVGPPGFEGRNSGSNNRSPFYGRAFAMPQHQHCAVHPEKWAAYLGAAYFDQLSGAYGGTNPVRFGLELFVISSDGITTENPEAYITGTYPTLSAPVFMGLGADNGRTT
jgi:hypothetical protein